MSIITREKSYKREMWKYSEAFEDILPQDINHATELWSESTSRATTSLYVHKTSHG